MLLPSSLKVSQVVVGAVSVYFADKLQAGFDQLPADRGQGDRDMDWPRLPRVLNAVNRRFGREVAVPCRCR